MPTQNANRMPRLAELIDTLSTIPPHGETVIRAAGVAGTGGLFAHITLDPSWFTAAGVFFNGLAAVIAIGFTIYKYVKGRK